MSGIRAVEMSILSTAVRRNTMYAVRINTMYAVRRNTMYETVGMEVIILKSRSEL